MGLFSSIFKLADNINLAFEHGDEFTRKPYILDKKTLSEKAAFYWNDIQKRCMHGPRHEFYWYEDPCTLGDAAIWQGIYLAMCCWSNRPAQASVALEGLEKMVYLGTTNRICRGADRAKDLGGDFNKDPNHKHFREGVYEWRADPSESSLIGPVFGLYHCITIFGDSSIGDRARRLVGAMAHQIVEDDYQLLNEDGSKAPYGDLRPLNNLLQFGKRKPVATGALCALLLLAFKSTGNFMFLDKYYDIADKHFDLLTKQETHVLWMHPQYQDILAFFNYTVLIGLDTYDLERIKGYRQAMRELYARNRKQGNTFYTYMMQSSVGGVGMHDLANSKKILTEFNTNPELGPTGKSPGGTDIDENFLKTIGITISSYGWKWLKGGKKLANQPVPPSIRPASDFIWQRSPYKTKGYEHMDYNGLDFLCAYYLGRQLGQIGEDE